MTNPNTASDFEKLFTRPNNYHAMSEERQWEVDKDLGLLDIFYDENLITPEMRKRYVIYFGL